MDRDMSTAEKVVIAMLLILAFAMLWLALAGSAAIEAECAARGGELLEDLCVQSYSLVP